MPSDISRKSDKRAVYGLIVELAIILLVCLTYAGIEDVSYPTALRHLGIPLTFAALLVAGATAHWAHKK